MAGDDIGNGIGRADRILVWLVVLTMFVGGFATLAVAFGADVVLSRMSQSAASSHAGDVMHGDDGHDPAVTGEHTMPMPMAMPSGSADHSMGQTPGH